MLPTLSIGGSAGSFRGNGNILSIASPFYGVDATGATHGAFVGQQSCHFLNGFLESNAPQDVLDFFGVQEPVECGPDLFPSGDVTEIVARFTTAFLDSQLDNDHTNEVVLTPDHDRLAGIIYSGPASWTRA